MDHHKKIQTTLTDLEELHNEVNMAQMHLEDNLENECEATNLEESMFPTSHPRMLLGVKKKGPTESLRLQMEISKYETFSISTIHIDVLQWRKNHMSVLPFLSRLSRLVMCIPALSSKCFEAVQI